MWRIVSWPREDNDSGRAPPTLDEEKGNEDDEDDDDDDDDKREGWDSGTGKGGVALEDDVERGVEDKGL